MSDAFVFFFDFFGGASQVQNCYSSVTTLVSGRWDVENDEVVALKSFMEDRCSFKNFILIILLEGPGIRNLVLAVAHGSTVFIDSPEADDCNFFLAVD